MGGVLHLSSDIGGEVVAGPAGDPEAARAVRRRATSAAVQRVEAFHILAHDGALLAVVGRLLGTTPLVHGPRVLRVLLPNALADTTPPHQDHVYAQGTQQVVTAWIPLTDCPRDRGGLRLLPGSHRGGVLPLVEGCNGWQGVAADEDDRRWSAADYSVGDVVLFHSLTVHAALPNLTDRARLSVDYRYQDRHEPIARRSLYPERFPNVPGWDDLCRAGRWARPWAPGPVTGPVVEWEAAHTFVARARDAGDGLG
jgi:hypothetical protein